MVFDSLHSRKVVSAEEVVVVSEDSNFCEGSFLARMISDGTLDNGCDNAAFDQYDAQQRDK